MNDSVRFFFKKHWIFISMNFGLIVGYGLFMKMTGYTENLDKIVFWAPDSQSYRDLGEWIFGISPKGWEILEGRPFLYPVMLNLARSVAGLFGVWVMQVLLWMGIANGVTYCVWRLTRSVVWTVLGGLAIVTNVSLLLLTAHGLTEISATSLLGFYALVVVVHRENLFSPRVTPLIILICSALAVVRPVFVPFLAFILAVAAVKWIWSREKLIAWAFLTIALLPLFIQLVLFKTYFRKWGVSHIGTAAVYSYYFSKVYAEVNHLEILEAREHLGNFSKADIVRYCAAHRKEAVKTYWENLEENFLSGSNFVNAGKDRPRLGWFSQKQNMAYWCLHAMMIPIFPYFLLKWATGREWEKVWLILSFFVPICATFFSAPLSFWQGDRLILPALPLWIILYIFLGSTFINQLFFSKGNKVQQSKHSNLL